MKVKFFRCKHCGKVIALKNAQDIPTVCCGDKMEELVANTVDAATEKHVPVFEQKEDLVYVAVGSAPHPMTPEHYIEFVALETNLGVKINYLPVTREAKTTFILETGESIERVFEYCNLHGLWSTD
ncbi:MAG: desulfoferrodoxin [Clostridia bacterium]|nr:desulfoferrodoxin [Clostridia bacterium]